MTVVIAGCGDLGTRIGLLLAGTGRQVYGLRRSPEKLPPEITGVRCDLSQDVPAVPADTEILVMATTADDRSEQGYRSAYVDALGHLLDGVAASAALPRRVLFVSSTSVYGGGYDGVVDEQTQPRPSTATAAALLDAEWLLHERIPNAVVLRLAGLYGPGRAGLIDRVRAGTAEGEGPDRYTNRIHRDDAAAAVVHLMTTTVAPAPLYLGVDDEPAPYSTVVAHLARHLGVSSPEPSGTVPEGKRCSNSLLTGTGFRLRYPTFREGYGAVLTEPGARYP